MNSDEIKRLRGLAEKASENGLTSIYGLAIRERYDEAANPEIIIKLLDHLEALQTSHARLLEAAKEVIGNRVRRNDAYVPQSDDITTLRAAIDAGRELHDAE